MPPESALDQRFGIEFEFGFNGSYYDEADDTSCERVYELASDASSRPVNPPFEGGYSSIGWSIHTDCGGVELATPPSRREHWDDIANVLAALRNDDAYEGESWGTHVHIDRTNYSTQENIRLVGLWCAFEPVLMQLIPKRRRSSGWCDPVVGFVTNWTDMEPWEAVRNMLLHPNSSDVRQIHIPKMAICYNVATWECRMHPCTLSIGQIRPWTEFLQAFFWYARNVTLDELESYFQMKKPAKRQALLEIMSKVLPDAERVQASLRQRWLAHAKLVA